MQLLKSEKTDSSFCKLACIIQSAWDYKHRMNVLMDSKWCDMDLFDKLYSRISILENCNEFDIRLQSQHEELLLFTRCHAYNSTTKQCYYVVFCEDPERLIKRLSSTFLICQGVDMCVFINICDGLIWEARCCNKELLIRTVFENI